ncbi:MAG: replicative DNA helicase [Spirulinaceae cyanobacterium]
MPDDFTALSQMLPPQNLEAEELILGGVLLDPEGMGRVADILNPKAFYDTLHRDIYGAMITLHRQGRPTDLMTVTSWLQDHDLLDKIGGTAKLAQLVERTVSAVNIDRYAGLIMDKFVRRQLIGVSYEIAELGYDTTEELEQVLDQSEQKVFALTQERPQQGLTPIADTLVNTFNTLESLQEKTALPGLTCGFYDLDAMTSGLQRSDLIILAGRPSMGKTALGLGVAANIAKLHQLPIAVFSLEMSKEQLAQRLLASEASIESNRLRSGNITTEEMEGVANAIGTLADLPIFIDDTATLTVMQMRSQVRRLQAEQGGRLGLVLLDYLQLMEGGGDNRVQELSKITRSLKGLAREVNAPVIALSQLSRGVESRTNKRPMMSDLRESGCLTGETLIPLVDTGQYVPLKTLLGKSNFQVWALNQQSWKIEPATVSQVFSTGLKETWRLTTRLGRTIRATDNHRFLTIQGWKRLGDLKQGEAIALPRLIPGQKRNSISHSELALLGHLMGDGCTLPRHAIQYTTREFDLAQQVQKLATEVFGETITPRIKQERNWYQVYLTSTQRLTHNVHNPVATWLDSLKIFGLRSHEKYVPQSVFQQSNEAISIFLRHLWSTDGSIKLVQGKSSRPTAYYATSSKQLAQDVQSLLLRININARLKNVKQLDKGREQYHVIITGKPDICEFIQYVGAVGEYKKQEVIKIKDHLKNSTHNPNRDTIPKNVWHSLITPATREKGMTQRELQAGLRMSYCGSTLFKSNLSRERATKVANIIESEELEALANSDVYWDQISSIESDGSEEVYDMTVPKLHNFIANDFIVHNSIEQDADLILMLYRDVYYNPDSPDQNAAELIITKHRNGPTGTVRLLFQPELTKFENLAQ